MWIITYFVLAALETIALFVYNLGQASSPQEQIWLQYSAERLGVLAVLLVVALALLLLTVLAIRAACRKSVFPAKLLTRESSLWWVMCLSLFAVIASTSLLIQPDDFFGDYLAVYENLRPVLFWLVLISLQTFFFLFAWYVVQFTEKNEEGVPALRVSELNILLAVFLGSMLIKVIFVLPNGYGMLKDVGETKYLYMLQYFNEGIFLHSATEFTTHYPPLYPLALMSAFSIHDYAYEVIKFFNALAASSLIFPVYFLARRFMGRRNSLFVIVITSLIPYQFLLPIRLLSENLYFPLLFLAVYLAFTQPVNFRYRFAWDCLTGFTLGLLYLTRYISLALIPFLLVVWWLKPFNGQQKIFHVSKQKFLHALMILLLAGITFLPWVDVGLENNLPVSQMLGFGIAANTNPAQLTFLNLLKWIAFYGAYFILLGAPVFNLLGISLASLRLKEPAREKDRWILTVLILMLAFGLAIVRHSWRADYNLELPKRLMGRYVIYFVPFFILTAFLAKKSFNRARYRNLLDFLLRCEILPLLLVGVSYLLVIRGSLIPVNSEFIHPLISIDGYYIQILGPYFFLLLAAVFTGGNLLLWFDRKEFAQFLLAGLVIYYLAGQPAYQKLMVTEQTCQQTGKIALDEMRRANHAAGDVLSYEILVSRALSHDELDDVAWTIFINHPGSEWEVGHYYPEKLEDYEADEVIIVLPTGEVDWQGGTGEPIMINGEPYTLRVVTPQVQ